MSPAVIAIIFVGLILAGLPLFVVLGAGSAICLHLDGYPLVMIPQQMFSIVEKDVLLAIPLFVLASTLLTRGEGAGRIADFFRSLVDWLPGGVALATIAACIFFAAISGLSPTAIITVGALMAPALKDAKYPDGFSLGLVTSAGSLGILVPPSIVVIIFGIMGEVNIQHLFVAGLTPILLIATLFAAYSVAVTRRTEMKSSVFSPRRIFEMFFRSFWALMVSLIIAGIYSGWFTITQAAAVAAAYALALELCIYRKISIRELPEIFRRAAAITGMILIIISVAMSFNWFLTVQGVPFRVTEFITENVSSKLMFLVFVNVFLLLLGCIMDILSAIFITVPLLLPAAVALGIDPVHFGIVFIVNFEIGYLTPPIGINLFTSSAVFRKQILEVSRSVLPFLALLLLALVLVTYFPALTLWPLRFLK
ncbi:MAG: TRAP transporter large permease subunit [bacterium]